MSLHCLPIVLTALSLAIPAPLFADPSVPLRLGRHVNNAEVTDLGNGVWEVRTTGGDPYVVCERLKHSFDSERLHVLAFEYQSVKGLDFLEVFWGSPFRGECHLITRNLPPAAQWREVTFDLKSAQRGVWDDNVRDFRLDIGSGAGNVVKVRRLRIRAMSDEERQAEVQRRAEEARKLRELHRRIEKALIAPKRLGDLPPMIGATHFFADPYGGVHVSVVGQELDLPTQVRAFADEVPAPAPLPPPLVVGEGDSPKNHTVLRLFNRHGLCEVQFLAFPPQVRGGVQVETGVDAAGEPFIAAAPLTDAATREVRVFSRHGNWRGSLAVEASVKPPLVLAAGDFLTGAPGDELAIASRAHQGKSCQVYVYAVDGNLLKTRAVPLPDGGGPLSLAQSPASASADGLIVYATGASSVQRVDLDRGVVKSFAAALDSSCTGVYPSAFDGAAFVATRDEPHFSSLLRLSHDGSATAVNVGQRENLFWFSAQGRYGSVPEGRYTRHSLFAHIRTDFGSPVASNPDFSRTDPDYWAGDAYQERVTARLANYDTDPPVCWEPCFTHRWFSGQAQKWAAARDAETGLPQYTLVDRDNNTGAYGEFGRTDSFVTGTYAPGLTALECFYTYPQRLFLRELSKRFRANPEHFVAVEPNHEMEINANNRSTHGDYNPQVLRAFCGYLTELYGSLDSVNRLFGTPFTPDWFDAPRDLQRGPWDAYSEKNPYYLVWMRFQNYLIYRIVAATYREALLAGFPPEAIRCHQIPDLYALASLSAFSRPVRRITPLDWNLNAGVGFGFTRYGLWFNREYNCVQGPHSSGFDAMVIGEYNQLHPSVDLAFQQLQYLRDHGVQFIHAMGWPKNLDKGYTQALEEALRRLVAEDKPRPGLTGGTGQVRPVHDGNRAYDLVSLGTQRGNTGLIKSLDAEGKWEGSTYLVPFHAHVDIRPLAEHTQFDLADQPLSLGPFNAPDAGNLFELSFRARAAKPTTLSLCVYHHEVELPAQRLTVPVHAEWQHHRCLVRVQIDTDDLRLELNARSPVTLRDFLALQHTEKSVKLKKGIFAGQRHEGGVRFAVRAGD